MAELREQLKQVSRVAYGKAVVKLLSRCPGGTVVECWIEDPEVPSSNTNQGSHLQMKKGHNRE